MLLVEALNIRAGGGLTLLSYLIEKLNDDKIAFKAIVNDQCKTLSGIQNTILVKSTILNRDFVLLKYYRKIKPDTILCFGNLPPAFSLEKSKVVTYFQNAHLLDMGRGGKANFRSKVRYSLLMGYIKLFRQNSDFYCFQTGIIKSKFLDVFNVKEEKAKVFPFFDLKAVEEISKAKKIVKNESNSFIYVSSNAVHKNHKTLIKAWLLLSQKFNITPKLYLTIPENDLELTNLISNSNKKGTDICNLGKLNHQHILLSIQKASYTIFPSTSETIGLGLVEGYLLGNKILAADLPYTRQVIKPSLYFEPLDPISIAEAVKKALSLKSKLPKPELIIENKINHFITFLTNYTPTP